MQLGAQKVSTDIIIIIILINLSSQVPEAINNQLLLYSKWLRCFISPIMTCQLQMSTYIPWTFLLPSTPALSSQFIPWQMRNTRQLTTSHPTPTHQIAALNKRMNRSSCLNTVDPWPLRDITLRCVFCSFTRASLLRLRYSQEWSVGFCPFNCVMVPPPYLEDFSPYFRVGFWRSLQFRNSSERVQ